MAIKKGNDTFQFSALPTAKNFFHTTLIVSIHTGSIAVLGPEIGLPYQVVSPGSSGGPIRLQTYTEDFCQADSTKFRPFLPFFNEDRLVRFWDGANISSDLRGMFSILSTETRRI